MSTCASTKCFSSFLSQSYSRSEEDLACSEIRVSNDIKLTLHEFHILLTEKLTLLTEHNACLEGK